MQIVLNLNAYSTYFTMACPQAVLKTDVFVEILQKFEINWVTNRKLHYLKLIRSTHNLKDGGKNWFNYLRNRLVARGGAQS